MGKLRVGVIGYGYWGPNLVRNFYAHEGSTVTVVCDLSEKNLKNVQEIYPAIDTTKNADELFSGDVDAVAIATPVGTHFELARRALEAGKHVLIEKPMTQTAEQGEELIALAKRNDRTLMVDHTFVYTGAIRKMRELIDSGELGELFYFDSTRINLGLLQEDVNVIWDLAPHDLSILTYLIDEKPTAVQAVGYNHIGSSHEELGSINIRYQSGFHAHLRVSWLSPVKMRTALLGGSKKMVVYNDVEPSEKIRVYDKGVAVDLSGQEVTAFTPIYRASDVLIPELDRTEALTVETGHFIDCIENGTRPLTGGEEGLQVVRMLEATGESLKHDNIFLTL